MTRSRKAVKVMAGANSLSASLTVVIIFFVSTTPYLPTRFTFSSTVKILCCNRIIMRELASSIFAGNLAFLKVSTGGSP